MPTPQELRRHIVQEGVRSLIEKANVPMRQHLAILKKLKDETSKNDEERSRIEEIISEFGKEYSVFKRELRAFMARDWTGPQGKSIKGDAGNSPDINEVARKATALIMVPPVPTVDEIAARLLPLIKVPEAPLTPSFDQSKFVEEVIETIIKDKRLDVSNLRNSESFMFNKKRYKFEELMRGGGAGTTTGGLTVTTQYLLTAVQSGSDITIALSQLAHFATFSQAITLTRNNQPQTLGPNFTITPTVITILNADAGEVFNLTYSYS